MNNRKKYALFALIASAGFACITSSHARSPDFDTSIPVIGKATGDIPVPKASAAPGRAAAGDGSLAGRFPQQLYSSEITFTDNKMFHAEYGEGRISVPNARASEAIARETARICGGDCAVTNGPYWEYKEYVVTFPDGWSYQITLDPYCVEFKTGPATLADLKRYRGRMQKYIFDIAHSQGLKGWGGGHIHMGFLPYFSADPKFLAKWITDDANHLFAAGTMEYNMANAKPIALLAPEKRRRFAGIIDAAYSGRIGSSTRLAEKIIKEVYSDPGNWKNGGGTESDVKYHEIQLYDVIKPALPDENRTIEMRALKHMTIDQMLLVMELFERRMEFVRRSGPIRHIDYGSRLPSMAERARLLRQYVLETGMDPKDFEFMLQGRWRRVTDTLTGAGT